MTKDTLEELKPLVLPVVILATGIILLAFLIGSIYFILTAEGCLFWAAIAVLAVSSVGLGAGLLVLRILHSY